MPSRCCIPNCKGNYDSSSEKKSIFKFPEEKELREKWIRNIPRKDFNPTKSSRVCEDHFDPHDVERETSVFSSQTGEKLTCKLRHPRLKANAVPSIFPGCPSYLSSKTKAAREDPEDKKNRLENSQLHRCIEESILSKQKEDDKNMFHTYEKFLACLDSFTASTSWTVIKKPSTVIFAIIEDGEVPQIKASVVVNKDLKITAYHYLTELHKCGEVKLPKTTSSIFEVSKILESMENVIQNNVINKEFCFNLLDDALNKLEEENEEATGSYKFLKEQVKLLFVKKEYRRYEPENLIFYSLLYSISPHAYKFIRSTGNVILPHPTTIRKITSNLGCNPLHEQNNFLKYMNDRVKYVKEHEKDIIVMLDEIHLKAFFDYKGGQIVGTAFDTEQAATTAHTFMISSLRSDYKDVVHILPVKCITAQTLHTINKKIIVGLEQIGFRVHAIITDNNAINSKAMSFFSEPARVQISYTHPCNSERLLFFIIDSVHIFKCIRNNWLNQKNAELCMYFPNFNVIQEHCSIDKLDTASFSTLRKLHELEHTNLIKYGYGLTLKALHPSNLERQSVKLVTQVFNEFVIQALLELGKKQKLNYYEGTASYLKIILQWWWIVNVKSPNKGVRLNNSFMYPLTNLPNDERRLFLKQFVEWLDIWENSGCTTGTLTKETHRALNHTCQAILKFSTFCCNTLGMKYVLTGKLQTDALEERFGKYRTLAGSQYSVSIRQIFESESKLRLQNFIPLILKSSTYGKIQVGSFDAEVSEETNASTVEDFDICDDIDVNELHDELPTLVYMAGYCVYSTCNTLKCDSCKIQLSMDREMAVDDCYNLISNLNRGGLNFPNADVIRVVSICFAIAEKLLSPLHEKKFLKVKSQRECLFKLALKLLTNFNIFNDGNTCSSGHSSDFIVRKILWKTTNILLKNYCFSKNDVIKKPVKKRKLDTLQK